MPVFRLAPELIFPPVHLAEPEGLLAIGGDLEPERLLAAYRQGIFPWYEEGGPILWWSPDPRLVLFPEELRVSKRLRRTIRQARFETRYDTAFAQVIKACAEVPRTHEDGTWITPEMQQAYIRLHQLGHAHSHGELAGRKAGGGDLWRARGPLLLRRVDVPSRDRCLEGRPGRARGAAEGTKALS